MSAEPPSEDSSTVYVPAFPDPRPDRDGVTVETRMLNTGEIAALAFTSQERLVTALGEAQPWIALPLGVLRDWMRAAGITTVAMDAAVPAESRRWRDIDVAALDALIAADGKEGA